MRRKIYLITNWPSLHGKDSSQFFELQYNSIFSKIVISQTMVKNWIFYHAKNLANTLGSQDNNLIMNEESK